MYTAHTLLVSALNARSQNKVIIDVPTVNKKWLSELNKLGFIQQRNYTRMILGQHPTFGYLEYQYAIAGPEIG